MHSDMRDKKKNLRQVRRGLEVVMVLVLALYPLRHIHRGLDLWDVGYNYANFQFMGTESMDPMWLFSTYIATAVGHLLTFLPFGKTLLGLNFFTGLSVSVLAVATYIFCTRKLGISNIIVFIGEFIAINLCWCPTALLYNYLTYILLLFSIAHIYIGLSEGKRSCLFVAGVCLGLNVFVRFSNLPEALLIVGVWAYCVLELIESIKGKTVAAKKRERREFFKRLGMRTLWCILGYLAGAGAMLTYIGLRYGLDSYIDGIKRLLSMSDEAEGYTAYSMLYSIYHGYLDNTCWIVLVAIFVVIGTVMVGLGKFADAQMNIKIDRRGVFGKKFSFTGVAYFANLLLSLLMIYLFWTLKIGEGQYSRFGYGNYDEYSFIIVPGIVVTYIMMLWALSLILFIKNSINEKLIAGLVFLSLVITPIGSNNGLLTTINNLFIALPWFIHRIWKLLVREDGNGIRVRAYFKENKDKNPVMNALKVTQSYLSFFPIKTMLLALLSLCSLKFILFGWSFSFTEAKNERDAHYKIENSEVLQGIRMSAEKADNMKGLMDFLNESGLSEDRELITYGYIPALSFYLQMPSAFNPWMDLASYNYPVMKEQIDALCETEEEKLPLIITTPKYLEYSEEEGMIPTGIEDRKWDLIMELIEAGEYKPVYGNDMFTVLANDGRQLVSD